MPPEIRSQNIRSDLQEWEGLEWARRMGELWVERRGGRRVSERATEQVGHTFVQV